MEKLLDIIICFPGECISIVIGVIGAIITISNIAARNNNESGEDVRQPDQYKHSIFQPYLPIIFMLIICVAILLIAFPNKEDYPPETTFSPSTSASNTEEPSPLPPKAIRELQKSDFSCVSASSTYDGDRATHIATNLIDGKKETNWTEGVNGYGVGQYVDFEFQKEQTITGFRICSGNHASDSYYTKNARPKVIRLTFEDGSSEDFTLLDVKEELTFQLSEAVTTKTVRLTIESVYEGDSWEDTVISEVVFLAEK